MKYAWLAAIAVLLPTPADAVTYKDIAGQWCGDVTDYVFTPNTLTVKFSRRQTGQCKADMTTALSDVRFRG